MDCPFFVVNPGTYYFLAFYKFTSSSLHLFTSLHLFLLLISFLQVYIFYQVVASILCFSFAAENLKILYTIDSAFKVL